MNPRTTRLARLSRRLRSRLLPSAVVRTVCASRYRPPGARPVVSRSTSVAGTSSCTCPMSRRATTPTLCAAALPNAAMLVQGRQIERAGNQGVIESHDGKITQRRDMLPQQLLVYRNRKLVVSPMMPVGCRLQESNRATICAAVVALASVVPGVAVAASRWSASIVMASCSAYPASAAAARNAAARVDVP